MGAYFNNANPGGYAALQTPEEAAAERQRKIQAGQQQKAAAARKQLTDRAAQIENKYAQYPGRLPGGTGPTGLLPNDAKGWSDMQNENTEYAQIQNVLAGKSPFMQVQAGAGYGGAKLGGSSMPGPATQALSRANAMDDEEQGYRNDLLRQQVYANQEAMADKHRKEANEAVAALYTPANDLYSGRTAAGVRAAGDVERDEFARDRTFRRPIEYQDKVSEAEAAGEGAVRAYNAFGADEMRRSQLKDTIVRAPYAPSVLTGGLRAGATAYTDDARVTGLAMQALAKLNSGLQVSAEERAAVTQMIGAQIPNQYAPTYGGQGTTGPGPTPGGGRGGGPGPGPQPSATEIPFQRGMPVTGGAPMGSTVQPLENPMPTPRDQLEDFNDEQVKQFQHDRNFPTEEQARAWLVSQGYRVSSPSSRPKK